MPNSPLAEIDASLQAIVRRAYDLGRDDALKKVVDALKADRACSEQLALMGPAGTSPDPGTEEPVAEEVRSPPPWWARPFM